MMDPNERDQAVSALTQEIIDGLAQLWNRIRARKAAQVALDSSTVGSLLAKAWDEGVATALNHAIRNDDEITLRLEHLDGRPWANPYRHDATQ